MRSAGWSAAVLAVIACVVGVRYATRRDESLKAVEATREERAAEASRESERPAAASEAVELSIANDVHSADSSTRVAVPTGRVFGMVMDATGAGLADVEIVMHDTSSGGEHHAANEIERTRSDAGGHFEFVHEWLPSLKLAAGLDGFDARVVAPQQGSITRILLWQHTLHATIRGRVVSSRGQPVPMCRLTIKRPSELDKDNSVGAHVDEAERGAFTLMVPLEGASPFRVLVEARAIVGQAERFRVGRSAEFDIAPDASIDDLVIVLEEASSVLQVAMLEPDGTRIGFWPHVDRIPREGTAELDVPIWRGFDGSFNVPLFGADSLKSLRVTHRDFAPRYVPLPSPNDRDGEVIVRMSRGASISGRVLDSYGEPQRDAVVNASAQDPQLWNESARTDVDGNYLFLHTPLGETTLSLQLNAGDARANPKLTVLVDANVVGQDFVMP